MNHEEKFTFDKPTDKTIDTVYLPGKGFNAPLMHVPRNQQLDVSFVQERLWFLEQMIPGTHNSYNATCLRGKCNLSTLERCLNEMIRRHESLRTNYKVVDGHLVQVINPPKPVSLSVVNLKGIPKNRRETKVLKFIEKDSQRPFKLDRDPLFRFTLVQLEPENYVLILTRHYILCDTSSMGIFFRELTKLYEAFSRGKPSPLAELPIQFADFTHWQRRRPITEIQTMLLSYWKQQLGDDLPVLQLPTDRPRVANQTFRAASQSLLLSKRLSGAIKTISRQESSSLFVLLLAAFKIFLYRYTGQQDIIVGTPTANRDRVELESLIGCFFNTLTLRTSLSGNPSFRELLNRVQKVTREAYAHQAVPFEIITKELRSGQHPRHDWPFQVMFTQQEARFYVPKFRGLSTKLIDFYDMPSKLDLNLYTLDTEHGLILSLSYNAELFNNETIQRMLMNFKTLLQGIVKNPDERITELPLLDEAERQKLIVEWNNTQLNYPKDLCLHHHFENQVKRTPGNIAVIFEDKQLSYQELNRRANQLAHHLQDLGIGPGAFVGLCMKRSEEIAITALGIYKAGGACVAIDHALPKERMALMLEEAQVAALVTQSDLLNSLPSSNANIVVLDVSREVIATKSGENFNSGVTPDHVAVVAYTSGSTGTPKGVLLTHRSASSMMLPETAVYRLGQEDGFLLTMYGFLTHDIFWPWLAGARAVIASDEGYRDSKYLVKLIVEKQVTVACFVPSMLQILLVEEDLGSCTCLKHVISTGEPLPVELKEHFFARLKAGLQNAYGQTEVGSTSWNCERESNQRFVPIGRGCANVEIYLLDSCLQPVPIGVAGEIYIHSANMALGYLNLPDLTAEKFIPNPFSDKPGERLYKTGDMAYYLPDGNLEFLGRKDYQVKIRGFRVELGEIEAVLSQYPDVKKTAVITRDDISGNTRLVAYIAPVKGKTPTISELRRFLKEKLPDYMVPGVFVLLDVLPLLPNGKVDRRALPAPSQTRPEIEERFVAPRNPVEETLAKIWAELLNLKQVGVYDNFFELGGCSLLAVRVVSRVRDVFQVEISLRDFFESPTIAALVERVETKRREGQDLQIPSILPVSRQMDLPLSFTQERLWALDHVIPRTPLLNMPTAVRLQGRLNVAALQQAFNAIVERHEVLRTTFTTVEGRAIQVISAAQSLPLTEIDLTELGDVDRETEAIRLSIEEAFLPFDLARGPLFRVKLLRLHDGEHILLLTMHHVVGDLWSMDVLAQEMSVLYEAFSSGRSSPLPPLPIQYADFAYWQRQCMQQGLFDAQLSYWEHQLGGKLSALELPTDSARSKTPSFRASHQSLVLPKLLSEGLKNLSRKEGYTLFMTLMSAFIIMLYRYTGQEDILVSTRVANRNRSETHGLIGLFQNVLLLRTELSGNPTLREVLQRVRDTALDSYTNQDIPFEVLVQTLERKRKLKRASLFQVMFIFADSPMQPLKLPGLSLKPLVPVGGIVELDLKVTTSELFLLFREGPEGLVGTLTYNTALFKANTIVKMLKCFENVVEDIISKPELRLSVYRSSVV